MTSPHHPDPYGGYPPPSHQGSQPQTGPTDQPPWAAPPIPSYVPPQPGQYQGPQDARLMPPPAPAAPSPQPRQQVRYADWGERVGATLLDWTVLFVAILVVTTVTGWSDSLSSLGGLAWLALAGYMAWLNGSKGQSPGKALMGIKVVRDADGSTLGGPVGLVRGIILAAMFGLTGGLLAILALLWPMWDRKRQALHDKVVSASVVAGYPRAKLGKDLFRP